VINHNLTIPCLKRHANDKIKRGGRSSSPCDLHTQLIDSPDSHTSLYKAIRIRLRFALLKIKQHLSCLYSLKIQYVNPYDRRIPAPCPSQILVRLEIAPARM
jgi:hypothetical protein